MFSLHCTHHTDNNASILLTAVYIVNHTFGSMLLIRQGNVYVNPKAIVLYDAGGGCA